MTLDGIKFPVYVIGTEDIETVDNIVFADGKVVDDKNMWGRTPVSYTHLRAHET